MTQTTIDRDLEHFLDIALQGKRPGSSGGEKAARKLALAFLDHGLGIDDSAIAGFIKFIRIAKSAPTTARDAIKAW